MDIKGVKHFTIAWRLSNQKIMEITTEKILQAIQEAKTALSAEKTTEKSQQIKESDLVDMIDHTLLRPDATEKEILKICHEAKQHHFYSVCVNSYYIPKVLNRIKCI